MFKGVERIWCEKQTDKGIVSFYELAALLRKTGMGSAIEIHHRYGKQRCSLPALRQRLEQMVVARWLAKSRVYQIDYYRLIVPPNSFSLSITAESRKKVKKKG